MHAHKATTNETAAPHAEATIGAVIVAAGMSSRMGDFKPMMSIGAISIAQRIVATLRQAGAQHIVVVTGFNADMLERHLSDNGLVFLRNNDYESTDMFASAKIGLVYLQSKCDRVLFTPVDIPLFTAGTVRALIASEAEIAIPVCGGSEGHPILLASRLIPAILDWPGEGGLRGAINALDAPVCHVPVRDAGILHDADTPQDYQALLEYHNKQLARTEIKVTLTRELPFFDEKMAMLLALIDETGSVRIACKRMQISYSTGWNMIRRLESQTKGEVLNRVQGGAGGGGSHLTANGRRLLEAYRQFVADIKDYAASRYDHYFGDDL